MLVEAAHRHNATKHNKDMIFVTLDESVIEGLGSAGDVLALDAALDALERLNPRQAEMVVCRFFGGLDIAETAAALDVSEATVQRDWRAVKAWLAKELRPRG